MIKFLFFDSLRVGLSVLKLNKYLKPKNPIIEINISTCPSSIEVN